jgi:hypothetical protein
VSWHKGRGKWKAHIKVDGKKHHLGTFADESAAARQYKKAEEARDAGRPLPVGDGHVQ